MTRRQTLRLIFHKDTIALIASLVFLWFTIGLLVDSNYRFEDLAKHSGQLVKVDSVITRVKDKPLFKEITKELRLTIDTDDNYFTSITTKDFGYVTSYISIGDTVNIFTKKKLWGIFGMKKARDISHFTKGDMVIIDFKKYRQSLSGLFIITVMAAIGFFIFFLRKDKKTIYFRYTEQPIKTKSGIQQAVWQYGGATKIFSTFCSLIGFSSRTTCNRYHIKKVLR